MRTTTIGMLTQTHTHTLTLTPNTAQYMKRRTSGVDLKDPRPIVLSYPLLHALLSVDLRH